MVNKFLYLKGGSETYMIKLGNYLSTIGHEVQYFGMDSENRCVGNNVSAYVANMDFHDKGRLKKLGYVFKSIYSFEARKKIRLVLDDFQPDVVHLNNFNYQLTPSVILEIVRWRKKNKRGCRIIYTAHDGQLICPNHRLRNPKTKQNCEKCLYGAYINCIKGKCIHNSISRSVIGTIEAFYWKNRHVYRNIDTIICCSAFYKAKLECNRQIAGRTVLIHNFVDKVVQEQVQKKNYVLYFGRYSEEKGIKTLAEACKQLQEVQFIFAGSGPLEEMIENVPNIVNVGFKSGVELENLIKEAKFSICPSEWYENCPFSVMESLMMGTPVLGSRIGGLPELIVDGETGELFESGNLNELVKKIRLIWSNENLLKKYTKNCHERINNDLEAYGEKLMNCYLNKD